MYLYNVLPPQTRNSWVVSLSLIKYFKIVGEFWIGIKVRVKNHCVKKELKQRILGSVTPTIDSSPSGLYGQLGRLQLFEWVSVPVPKGPYVKITFPPLPKEEETAGWLIHTYICDRTVFGRLQPNRPLRLLSYIDKRERVLPDLEWRLFGSWYQTHTGVLKHTPLSWRSHHRNSPPGNPPSL